MGGADPVNDAAHLSRLTDWCYIHICMYALSIQVNALTYIYTHTYIHNAHSDYMWQLEAVVTMTRLIFALIWTFSVTPELQLFFFKLYFTAHSQVTTSDNSTSTFSSSSSSSSSLPSLSSSASFSHLTKGAALAWISLASSLETYFLET